MIAVVVVVVLASGCSDSGHETGGDGLGLASGYGAPAGSSEVAGAGDAAIKGTSEVAKERYRRNAMEACEQGNDDACDDADAWERGEGPPIFVDGKPRPLYKVR